MFKNIMLMTSLLGAISGSVFSMEESPRINRNVSEFVVKELQVTFPKIKSTEKIIDYLQKNRAVRSSTLRKLFVEDKMHAFTYLIDSGIADINEKSFGGSNIARSYVLSLLGKKDIDYSMVDKKLAFLKNHGADFKNIDPTENNLFIQSLEESNIQLAQMLIKHNIGVDFNLLVDKHLEGLIGGLENPESVEKSRKVLSFLMSQRICEDNILSVFCDYIYSESSWCDTTLEMAFILLFKDLTLKYGVDLSKNVQYPSGDFINLLRTLIIKPDDYNSFSITQAVLELSGGINVLTPEGEHSLFLALSSDINLKANQFYILHEYAKKSGIDIQALKNKDGLTLNEYILSRLEEIRNFFGISSVRYNLCNIPESLWEEDEEKYCYYYNLMEAYEILNGSLKDEESYSRIFNENQSALNILFQLDFETADLINLSDIVGNAIEE